MPLADIVRQHLMPVAAASGAAIGVAAGLRFCAISSKRRYSSLSGVLIARFTKMRGR